MHAPETLLKAVSLTGFDAPAAQLIMATTPRTMVRPPELSGTPRTGAVLLLLYPKKQADHLLFIRRQENLTYHPGQISFPGGRHEPGETLLQTALRETVEETGLAPKDQSVLGGLESVYIPPSDFIVHPFVAWHNGTPTFRRDPSEVAEIIEAPLGMLRDPAIRKTEVRTRPGKNVTVPYFDINGHKVWGATAMILSEFLERLDRAEQV